VQKVGGRFHDRPRWTTDTLGLLHNVGVAEPGQAGLRALVLQADDFDLRLRRMENRRRR